MKDWKMAIVWFVVLCFPILCGMVLSVSTRSFDYVGGWTSNYKGDEILYRDCYYWMPICCLLEVPWFLIMTHFMYPDNIGKEERKKEI